MTHAIPGWERKYTDYTGTKGAAFIAFTCVTTGKVTRLLACTTIRKWRKQGYTVRKVK